MTLDLCHMPKPAKSLSNVSVTQSYENGDALTSDGNTTFLSLPLSDDPPAPTYVNLWEVKRVYGFFPFTKVVDGTVKIAVSALFLF